LARGWTDPEKRRFFDCFFIRRRLCYAGSIGPRAVGDAGGPGCETEKKELKRMAIFGFLLLMAVVLPINAWLLKVAVKIVREQITYPSALIVAFVSMLTSGIINWFGLGLIGSLAGWIVSLTLLKKLSSIEDLWPTAVLVAFVFTILSTLCLLGMVMLAGLFG
jgi:hypothetical protein